MPNSKTSASGTLIDLDVIPDIKLASKARIIPCRVASCPSANACIIECCCSYCEGEDTLKKDFTVDVVLVEAFATLAETVFDSFPLRLNEKELKASLLTEHRRLSEEKKVGCGWYDFIDG